MFVDMRGSTKLSEVRLPFDIVFLINQFIEAASQAITDAGGQPNQFIGDGVLALFGLDVEPTTACRQALRAASLVSSNVAYLNHQFTTRCASPSSTESAYTPVKLSSAISAFAVTRYSPRSATASVSPRGCRTRRRASVERPSCRKKSVRPRAYLLMHSRGRMLPSAGTTSR